MQFSIAVLSVNRQFYAEGCDVLYGENTFAFKIWEKYGDGLAYFLQYWRHPREAKDAGFPLEKVKRYFIKVKLQDVDEFEVVEDCVKSVADVLSETPKLTQLDIKLELSEGVEGVKRVLESFALLRNVQTVNLVDVPPEYAKYLKTVMEGNEPVVRLARMYQALESYAGPFVHCGNQLQEACEAMEEFDVEKFKTIRAEVITSVEEHMEEAKSALFEHDAKDEGEDAAGSQTAEQSKH